MASRVKNGFRFLLTKVFAPRGEGERLARPADVDETLFGNNNYRETRDMGKYSGCWRRRLEYSLHATREHIRHRRVVCKFANTRERKREIERECVCVMPHVSAHVVCIEKLLPAPNGEHERERKETQLSRGLNLTDSRKVERMSRSARESFLQ